MSAMTCADVDRVLGPPDKRAIAQGRPPKPAAHPVAEDIGDDPDAARIAAVLAKITGKTA